MSPSARRWLGTFIRLLVVAAAVLWLARELKWDQLRAIYRSSDRRLLLLGILAYGPAPLLSVLRLRTLLAVHDIHIRYWELTKIVFGGNFLISALPVGTSGGDTAKAVAIAQRTPHKHEAVTTVFFDRLVGLVGLVLVSGVMVLLNWHNPAMASRSKPIGIAALVFFLGAAAYFSDPVRSLLRLDDLIRILPFGHHIQRIDRAVLAFRKRGKRVAVALLLTVVLQFVGIVALFLMGWGLGLAGGQGFGAFPTYLAYIPICFIAGALPLGVMEVTFVELFAGAAHLGPAAAAISLSILSRVMQLIWALPGGLVVLSGGYRHTPEEIREAEAELDHDTPESPASQKAPLA